MPNEPAQREPGIYRLKELDGTEIAGRWQPPEEGCPGHWFVVGCADPVYDDELAEIGPRIPDDPPAQQAEPPASEREAYRIFVDHCKHNASGGPRYSDCVCDHCMKVKRGNLFCEAEIAPGTSEEKQ